MTRREIAFLLIGLGVGLTLAVVAVVQILMSMYASVVYSWNKPIDTVPFLLMVIGLVLLILRKGKRERAKD
jgi:hypothetical protein